MSNKKKSKNKGKQKDSFAKNGGTGYGRSISSGDVPKKEAPKSSAGQDDSTAASVAAFAERLKAMSGVVNSPEITDQRQQVITRLMTAFKSLSDPPESLAKIFERVGLPVKIVENVPGDPKYNSMIIMVEDFKAAETKLQEQGTVLDRLYPKPVVPQQDSSVKDSPNISDLGADTNIQMTRTQVIGGKTFSEPNITPKGNGHIEIHGIEKDEGITEGQNSGQTVEYFGDQPNVADTKQDSAQIGTYGGVPVVVIPDHKGDPTVISCETEDSEYDLRKVQG